MRIRILIIVPTLNSYKKIGRLVTTLFSQTYQNWKLVFVDGDSTKKHKSILLNYVQKDKRISIINQDKNSKGIFGAMNQGFLLPDNNSWIFFWGSDDWLPHEDVLLNIVKRIEKISHENKLCDLLICNARYSNYQSLKLFRKSKFHLIINFKLSMFLGFSPPHQACLISPNLKKYINNYDENLNLSADLNYFLQLSNFKDLNIQLFDYEIIYLGCGGESRRRNFERTKQVFLCYWNTFGILFFMPFILRYVLRLISLVKTTKFNQLFKI